MCALVQSLGDEETTAIFSPAGQAWLSEGARISLLRLLMSAALIRARVRQGFSQVRDLHADVLLRREVRVLRCEWKDLTCDLRSALLVGVGAEDKLFEPQILVGGQLFGCLLGGAHYGGA